MLAVVVQFYPWLKLYFPLFMGMAIYDIESETRKIIIISTKDKKIKNNITYACISFSYNPQCIKKRRVPQQNTK